MNKNIKNKSMQGLLESIREEYGQGTAIVQKDMKMSYEDLYKKVKSLASAFRCSELMGKYVDLTPKLSLEWICVYLALNVAGITVVLHEPGLNVSEYINEEVLNADASILFEYDKKFSSFSEDILDVSEDTISTIIFTSGTSGRKKGVMLTQKNIVSDTILASEKVSEGGLIKAGDRTIAMLPVFHMFGITASIFTSLYMGVAINIFNDVTAAVNAFPIIRPKILYVVPMICKSLLSRAEILRKQGLSFEVIKKEFFGDISVILSGGAPIAKEVAVEYEKYGIKIFNGYGITECSPVVTTSCLNDYNKGTVGNVLHLIGAEVRIIDGQIHVSGDIVMKGYYGNVENPFVEVDGKKWFNTRDKGIITDEGLLIVEGRQSNLIILDDGNNIMPEEIELLFEEFEIIQDTMVYVDESNDRKRLSISVVPTAKAMEIPEDQLTDMINSIVAKVNSSLPLYKQLRKITVRKKDFLRTSLNKVIRSSVNY